MAEIIYGLGYLVSGMFGRAEESLRAIFALRFGGNVVYAGHSAQKRNVLREYFNEH